MRTSLILLSLLSLTLGAEEALDHFNPIATDVASKVFKSIHGAATRLTFRMQAVPDVAIPPDTTKKSYVVRAQDDTGKQFGTIRLELAGERLVHLDYLAPAP
ncbi:MAG: hypothetical protein H0W78_03265 [Planctomycetes bacterium]|jgi:hypothetical protein|nr:hypothetical protein [Planctomycetota bacterium]